MDQGEGSQSVTPPADSGSWWTVSVLTVLYSISFMDRQVFALLIEPIRLEMGISDFQAGLLSGLAFSVFYATFGLLCGWAVDRFRRQTVVFVGVVVWSAAASLCGLAGNFLQLASARFAVGAGEAALVPAANSILSDTFPPQRLATAISVFGIGPAMGGLLAMLIAAGVLAIIPPEGLVFPAVGLLEPWRVVFLATGLPGIVIAFLVWSFREPPRRQLIAGDEANFAAALRFMKTRRRFFAAHIVGVGLMCAAAYGMSSWAAVWFVRVHGLSLSQAGLLYAAVGTVPGIISVVVTGVVTDRLFARGMHDAHLRIMIVLCVLQLGIMSLNLLGESLWLVAGSLVLFNLGAGFAGIAPAALQLVTPSAFRGRVAALYGLSPVLIGFGLGPTLVGALNTYAFADPMMIGRAIVASFWIVLPLAILFLLLAMKPMRAAVAEAEQGRLVLDPN